VLTEPDRRPPARRTLAILLLNAGLVHRVGPNRLYVTLARRLAEMGYPVLRFDLSGIGDSPPRSDHLPFDQSSVEEAIAAMDLVAGACESSRFVLAGICSGADVALLAAARDRRVVGVAAINARRFGAGDAAFAAIRRRALAGHYRRIAASHSFGGRSLAKLAAGRMEWRAVLRALESQLPRLGGRAVRGSHGLDLLLERGTAIFCLHSEADEGLDYLYALAGRGLPALRERPGFRFEIMEGADHTFTMRWSQRVLLERLAEWMEGLGS
jgi:pimeloyl-ACP methyl ester carboxylesterase